MRKTILFTLCILAFQLVKAQNTNKLENTGNVGIGTLTPKFPLDIRTNTSFEGNNLYFGNNRFYLARLTGTGNQAYGGLVINRLNGGIRALDFVVGNNNFNTTINPENLVMRVQSNGNVGIGTDNPTQKLTVKGQVLSEEVKVQLSTAWPDYVFADDYQLQSLESVAAYIQSNGHLPNIPSAEEIEKAGGVALGDMNTRLLEKIEELTLYMIELKKENEDLKQVNEQVVKRLESLESTK